MRYKKNVTEWEYEYNVIVIDYLKSIDLEKKYKRSEFEKLLYNSKFIEEKFYG